MVVTSCHRFRKACLARLKLPVFGAVRFQLPDVRVAPSTVSLIQANRHCMLRKASRIRSDRHSEKETYSASAPDPCLPRYEPDCGRLHVGWPRRKGTRHRLERHSTQLSVPLPLRCSLVSSMRPAPAGCVGFGAEIAPPAAKQYPRIAHTLSPNVLQPARPIVLRRFTPWLCQGSSSMIDEERLRQVELTADNASCAFLTADHSGCVGCMQMLLCLSTGTTPYE